jgi:hypothetical protein
MDGRSLRCRWSPPRKGWRPAPTGTASGPAGHRCARPREALLTALARTLVPALDFAPLPAREAGWMARAFRAAGWIAAVEPAHVNRHPGARRPRFRHLVGQPPRRAARHGAAQGRGAGACRIATTFDAADWDAYEAIYAASWKPAGRLPAFLREFAIREGAAGALRLGLAMQDGMPSQRRCGPWRPAPPSSTSWRTARMPARLARHAAVGRDVRPCHRCGPRGRDRFRHRR